MSKPCFYELLSDGGGLSQFGDAPALGVWVTLLLSTGHQVTGVARMYDNEPDITLFCQTNTDQSDPTFEQVSTFLNVDHVVMVRFAGVGG